MNKHKDISEFDTGLVTTDSGIVYQILVVNRKMGYSKLRNIESNEVIKATHFKNKCFYEFKE